jgi:hypothetical protein
MDTSYRTEEYEDALTEERLMWKQLDEPSLTDVTERVKAYARWSAAAERARAMACRLQEETTAAEPH